MASPDLASRARGALLGHLLGAVLDPDGQVDLAPSRRAEHRLSELLAEELLHPEIDLHRLALRWAAEAEQRGEGLEPWTRTALAHIHTHNAPPGAIGVAGPAVLTRALPLILRTLEAPANRVSGTYHLSVLTHPDEQHGWAAVAFNMAAATLVSGRRDFGPDVLEVLRNNAAPDPLLQAIRRIPLERRDELPASADDPVGVIEVALWLAQHEPNLERGLLWLASDRGRAGALPAAGALLGARDGDRALPPRWRSALPGGEALALLAVRLLGLP